MKYPFLVNGVDERVRWEKLKREIWSDLYSCELFRHWELFDKYEDDLDNGFYFSHRLHYALSEYEHPNTKFHPETGKYNWKQLVEDWHNGDKKIMCEVEHLRGYTEETNNET